MHSKGAKWPASILLLQLVADEGAKVGSHCSFSNASTQASNV